MFFERSAAPAALDQAPDISEVAAIAARTAVVVRDDSRIGEDLIARFVEELQQSRVRVGGVYQRTRWPQGGRKTMCLIDAATGKEFSISIDEGPKLDLCVVDTAALADACVILRKAIVDRVDLLVVNKVSKQEAAGRGLAPDLLDAMAEGIPVLTSLHQRYLPQWQALSGGIGTLLPAELAALRAWWSSLWARPGAKA